MRVSRKTGFKSKILEKELTDLWESLIYSAEISENRLILSKYVILLLYFKNILYSIIM